MIPLRALIEKLERDRWLEVPQRLRERVEALDRLETYLPQVAAGADEAELVQRAAAVRGRLEAVNHRLFAGLRDEIRRGHDREDLLRWFAAGTPAHAGEGYDYLDELLGGVLPIEPPDEVEAPPAEMVFYQPTPARHIVDLIARAELTPADVLIDLGSGLGHVPLLAALCTDAHCIGFELEATYVARARQCAEALKLTNAEFVQQDVRAADLSRGTVFYLYTPFSGSILRAVLDALHDEAGRRAIRVCTYGPCTPVIVREPWLEAMAPLDAGRIAVFGSPP